MGGATMIATGGMGTNAAAGTTGTTGGATSSGGMTSYGGTIGTTVLRGVFVPTDSMTVARYSHTAALLPSGKVLIAGGFCARGPCDRAELYDPASGTFTAASNMTVAREDHTATLLSNGKVLIAGGKYYAETDEVYLAGAELYDPAAGTFTATGSMTVARDDHTSTLLSSGKVLIAGGVYGTVAGSVGLASAELYDPSAGTFTATGRMSTARSSHTATLLPSGKVLIAGGFSGSAGSASFASAELYDPTSGTFTFTGRMTAARDWHTATLLSNGKVLIAGGEGTAALASAELYDPGAGTFTATGSMTVARDEHTSTLLSSGKVLIAGGTAAGSVGLASAELYDPSAGTFKATGTMTTARQEHTATLLPNGTVLIAGGSNGGDLTPQLGSAELYE
jgi:hypothetical protein